MDKSLVFVCVLHSIVNTKTASFFMKAFYVFAANKQTGEAD